MQNISPDSSKNSRSIRGIWNLMNENEKVKQNKTDICHLMSISQL